MTNIYLTIRIFIICNSRGIIRVIKSRRMRWAGHVASLGIKTDSYRILVEKPEGKKSLAISRRRWENNIKTHLTQGVDWIGLA
jgi:hypothetical protein